MSETKTPFATTPREASERDLSSSALATNCYVPAHLSRKRLPLFL